MKRKEILIEGLTPSEIISLEDLEGYAVAGRPIVISVGSAEVLAEFSIAASVLSVEIAVVENGGEGVLPILINVIEKSAMTRGFTAIEWSVYARNCATPNPKLSRVLERLGFDICKSSSGLEFYWQRQSTNSSLLRRND